MQLNFCHDPVWKVLLTWVGVDADIVDVGLRLDGGESLALWWRNEWYIKRTLNTSSFSWVTSRLEAYCVLIPHLYDFCVSGHNQVQLVVEVEWLDWQVVVVVSDQQRLAGAQVIEQHLRDKEARRDEKMGFWMCAGQTNVSSQTPHLGYLDILSPVVPAQPGNRPRFLNSPSHNMWKTTREQESVFVGRFFAIVHNMLQSAVTGSPTGLVSTWRLSWRSPVPCWCPLPWWGSHWTSARWSRASFALWRGKNTRNIYTSEKQRENVT